MAIKKAKEDLEDWLKKHSRMTPRVRYSKADDWFGKEAVWKAVTDGERRVRAHPPSFMISRISLGDLP